MADHQLSSPLPSQGEPVGYADAADIVAMANVRRNGGSGMIRVTSSASGSSDAPLYTAEALAAAEARADRAEEDEREACLAVIADRLVHWRAVEKEYASTRDLQSAFVSKAAKHKADFAEEITTALRARTILKETPHGER